MLFPPAYCLIALVAVEALGFRMVYGKGEAVDGPDEREGAIATLPKLDSGKVLEGDMHKRDQAIAIRNKQ